MSFELNGVEIEDTFAEAFAMWGNRMLITAKNKKWALTAAKALTGFATSVIGCGCEAVIEGEATPEETPDGRPGVYILTFARSKKKLSEQLLKRIGQCILTCPTAAAYNKLPLEEADATFSVGGKLRYFGDGYQISKRFGGKEAKRLWRIPVMEGESLIEDEFGAKKAVAGGNFIILGETADATLEAAEKAVDSIGRVKGAITPFPGGICRSGSKVGSKYRFLGASTNTKLCPTIRAMVPDSEVPEGVSSVLEIVINGLDLGSVKRAMANGIQAAVKVDGVKKITAGNYGGRLGKYNIYLKECLAESKP